MHTDGGYQVKFYILYGKGPIHKQFRPIDCTTGKREINFLNVTVFDENEAQAVREDFGQMHAENPGWCFELRHRFSMDEKKLDEAVQTVKERNK